MPDQALLTSRQAAAYLGVSRTFFFEHIRPFVAVVDLRAPGASVALPRFARVDLDAFWTARRKERKAS